MAIFGSYIGKDHSLMGESVRVVVLDTFVAITAGLIIFPACFTYGVDQTSGPSLIFITLPNIFANMPYGRLWGSLFFLFMAFAASVHGAGGVREYHLLWHGTDRCQPQEIFHGEPVPDHCIVRALRTGI